jgi:hypothetical protein
MSKKTAQPSYARPVTATLALLSTAFFVTPQASANPLLQCSALAPLLLKNRDITAATSAVQPASQGNASYCLVNITVSDLGGSKDGYLPNQKQKINIEIGLPLSPADGGTGGTFGAWNERIEDIGGGGYSGLILPVTQATNAGFAGSGTDTGHTGNAALGGPTYGPVGDGTWALNPDNTLNWGLIRDFSINALHEQATWSKNLVNIYYGKHQKYAYFGGCSLGGRQAHLFAQKFPLDYNGILAQSSAVNWDRLFPGQLWPQVVMNQEVGAPIAPEKLQAVTQAAIAACDGIDGILDGVIQDTRACHYSAKSFVCTGSPNDPANCLTAAEAGAVDKIWDGFTTGNGELVWPSMDRGAPLSSLAGPVPLVFATQWFQYWVKQNPSFDWHTFTEANWFNDALKPSELKFHDVLGTDDPDLSAFRGNGGKMFTVMGLADELDTSRGMYNYYNRVTLRMGGLERTQSFYRFFPYPGGNHCGGNSTQPNAPIADTSSVGNNILTALKNWVELGVAPDSIVAYNNANPALATVSRPICKYPDTLVYNGSGSTNAASNFHCKIQKADPLMNAEKVLPDVGYPQYQPGF